jgi:hypothetical protein
MVLHRAPRSSTGSFRQRLWLKTLLCAEHIYAQCIATILMGNKPDHNSNKSLTVSSTDQNKSLPVSSTDKSLPASDHNKLPPTSKIDSLPACFVADQPAYCLMLNSLGEPYSEAAHGPDPLGKGFAYRAPVEWVAVRSE